MKLSLRQLLENSFGIDGRTLALFRISMGVLLLRDLSIRATTLAEHYTDAGLLPRAKHIQFWGSEGFWSLHLLDGGTTGQAVLFLIAAAAAVGLAFGWHTRLMTLISWVMLISLQYRNPLVLNSGDTLITAMLFWSLFLPLGQRGSLDARRRGDRGLDPPGRAVVLSVASAAILIQLALMYIFTGLFKWNSYWHSGQAMDIILRNDLFVRPLGRWLHGQEGLCVLISKGTPWFELLGTLPAFIPFWTARFRALVMIAFVSFHITVDLTLTTGMFPHLSLVAWTLFVPGAWWDWLGRRIHRGKPAEEAPAQPPVVAAPPRSGWWWAGQAALLGCLVTVIVWNTQELSKPSGQYYEPTTSERIKRAVGMRQRWNMFEVPGDMGGWYVIVGETEDGREFDLLTGQPFDPTAGKPADVNAMFPNQRSRKVYDTMRLPLYKVYRPLLGPALCNMWNMNHPEINRIDRIEINYVEDKRPEEGEAPRLRRLVFYRGVCARPGDIILKPPTPEAQW